MTSAFKPPPLRAWMWAIRIKTLTVALIAVFVGTSLAYTQVSEFSWGIAACMLVSALFIQAGANLINDWADHTKGADSEERVGFPRATQMGWLTANEVFRGALIAFGLGTLFALPLVYVAGFPVILLLVASIAAAYLYTAGPYPLAYHGLGELFVILFCGFVLTMVPYFVQTHFFSWESALAGLQLGLLSTSILAINNLRDIHQDRKSGKGTLAARYGIAFGRYEIVMSLVLPFLMLPLWAYFGYTIASFLPFCILPLAAQVIILIHRYPPGPIYNSVFGLAALTHLLFGVLLGSAFLIQLI